MTSQTNSAAQKREIDRIFERNRMIWERETKTSN